jgi:Tfp pilus tip-associated adhesin PilY1
MLLDTGAVLQSTASTSRTIKTYKGGALADFSTSNIAAADVRITSGTTTQNNAARDAVVGFFRGERTYNIEDWKLGDVFRSTPITVGTPSVFFDDIRDSNNAFATFRSNHVRSSSGGNRLIVAGANDGQFHAFKMGDMTEVWNFIAPQPPDDTENVSHATHNATAPITSLTHQYFVDGAFTVTDVWLGTAKTADWKTILVFGEGRGAVSYSWSSSTSCDSGINATYLTTYPYYCGYWAFDLSTSTSPAYMWRLMPTAAQAPYSGDPWNKMMRPGPGDDRRGGAGEVGRLYRGRLQQVRLFWRRLLQ